MIKSFKHAIEGILWSINNNFNFNIHLAISILILFLSFLLKITKTEFLIIIFAIILGLVVEMVNTAIEEMTNLITIKWAKQAKIAKDVASGMMLLTSIATAIIGLIIFIPYLI